MDWGNAFVRKIVGSPVESIELELNLEGDFKKTKKKVTWLASPSASPAALTPVCLLDYDYLITKKKLEEDDSVENFLTPVTEFAIDGVADINVKTLKKGDIIQFERKGYYIIDKPVGIDSELLPGAAGNARVEAIFIPDGRAQSIALKYVAPVVTKQSKTKAEKKIVGNKIPSPAPIESITTVLLSEGNKGFEIPILTKMYRVENVYGDEGVAAVATTKMYDVTPIY